MSLLERIIEGLKSPNGSRGDKRDEVRSEMRETVKERLGTNEAEEVEEESNEEDISESERREQYELTDEDIEEITAVPAAEADEDEIEWDVYDPREVSGREYRVHNTLTVFPPGVHKTGGRWEESLLFSIDDTHSEEDYFVQLDSHVDVKTGEEMEVVAVTSSTWPGVQVYYRSTEGDNFAVGKVSFEEGRKNITKFSRDTIQMGLSDSKEVYYVNPKYSDEVSISSHEEIEVEDGTVYKFPINNSVEVWDPGVLRTIGDRSPEDSVELSVDSEFKKVSHEEKIQVPLEVSFGGYNYVVEKGDTMFAKRPPVEEIESQLVYIVIAPDNKSAIGYYQTTQGRQVIAKHPFDGSDPNYELKETTLPSPYEADGEVIWVKSPSLQKHLSDPIDSGREHRGQLDRVSDALYP